MLETLVDPETTDDPANQFRDTNATDVLHFEAEYGTDDASACIVRPVSEDRLEIHWPHKNAYYPGRVSFIDPAESI